MLKILFIILSVYIGSIIYLYFTQDSKIFNFSVAKKQKPKVLTFYKDTKEVKLYTNNAILNGVYKKTGSEKIIIYFGDNSNDATNFLRYCDDLKDFDIVLFNYRGNALSTGTPTEKDILNDALKIYDAFAKEKECYAIGRSLGSGVATYLASKRKLKKLLLITPYDSVEAVAKEKYPFFPISLLIKHRFNSISFIKNVKTPTTVFMVERDSTVSNERTKNLTNHIKNLSNLVVFKNATHANILDMPKFKEELKKWAYSQNDKVLSTPH